MRGHHRAPRLLSLYPLDHPFECSRNRDGDLPAFYAAHYYTLHLIDQACLAIFIAEMGLKVIARGSLRKLLSDPWDAFDFFVVAIALVSWGMSQVGIARIFRLLRVLRAVTYLKQLRLLVYTLLKTLPSLGNIIILMSIQFYVFATIGSTIFGRAMPEEFGNLGYSALTLFGVVTLEGWVDLLAEASAVTPYAWIYFVSFILLGTFIIINLFVAVVVSNLEESFREQEAAKHAADLTPEQLLARLQALSWAQTQKLEELNALLASKNGSNGAHSPPPKPKKRRSRSKKRSGQSQEKSKAA